PARATAARSPPRSSCSASSTARHGRISTSRAPRCRRRRPTSTPAGAPATAYGCSIAWWRITTNVDKRRHDRGPVLSPAGDDARARAAAVDREVAGAQVARGRADLVGGTRRRARLALVDLSRRFVPAARHLARSRCGRAPGVAVDRERQPERRANPVPGGWGGGAR